MGASLALRIKVFNQSQATGEVRRFAGSMDVVSTSAQRAKTELKGTADAAQQVGVHARQARAMEASVKGIGTSAGVAQRGVTALASSAVSELKEGEGAAKRFSIALLSVAKSGAESWTGMQFSVSGVIGKIKEAEDRIDSFRKKAAFSLIGGGVATGGLLGKMVADAGQVQLVEAGLKTNLKGSGVSPEEMMEELRQFDADSQLNFLESAQTANRLVARGFAPNEVIPMMRLMGDAVGAQGGGQEEFGRMALAISQIKARGGGKYSAEEGNQLADLGINATRIISQATGVSESDIASGEHEVTGDQALKAILDGLKQFEGGMEAAAETLPGKLSTLSGAFFQLNAAIGVHMVPAITAVVGVVTSGVNAFNSLPEPIHKVISYSMALNAGFLTLMGTLLLIASPLLSVWGAFRLAGAILPGLNSFLGLFGTSAGRLAVTLGSRLLPMITGTGGLIPAVAGLAGTLTGVLLPALGILALGAITAAAIIKGIEWYNDAKTKSDANMESEGPVEGFIARAGRWLGDNSGTVTNEDKRAYDEYVKTQQKYGREVKSLKEWKGNSTASDEASGDTPEQIKAQKEKEAADKMKAQFGPQLAMLQTGGMNMPDGITGSTLAGVSGVSTSGGDTSAQESAINAMESELDGLRAQLRAATGKENADLRKTLQERIAQKGIQMREARQALAADKRATSAAERDRKKAEREAEKALKADVDNAQLEYDVKEAEAEEGFNTRITSLEAQRDAAREAKDEAKEAALKFEIAKMQAERDYALAKIRADQTGLEDEKKRDAMLRIAEARKRGALQRAQIEFNSAKNKGVDTAALAAGGSLKGLPPGLATRAVAAARASGGAMFDPYATTRDAPTYRGVDATEAFTRASGVPRVQNRISNYAQNMRRSSREWVVRAKNEVQQAADGKKVLRILVDDVPIPNEVAAMGSRV